MPSGAKKRKAAKKKKEKEANINPSTNNPQGNDDLKSQDEKGSDGGEASSPVYHDHDDHHQPFNGGSEEVEVRNPSAPQSSVSDVKSLEEVPSDITSAKVLGGKEDSVIKVERYLKYEETSDRINDSVEHIESAKESRYGNGNSSGTSNDESINKNNSKDEPDNSKQEAIICEDLINSVNSSADKMTLTTENAPVEETGNLVVETSVNSEEAVASVCEVKSSDKESALLEKSAVSQVASVDLAMKKNEDKVYPLSDGHVRTSNLEDPKQKENDSEVSASFSDSPVTKSTKVAEHIKDSDIPESSENQPQVASAPRIVQKTSWFSCCGLLELLSGSDR